MGAVTGMLGLGGGAGGTNFQGPQSAPIVNPVTAGQISQNFNDTQSSLQAQQQLLAAIQGQNGLQNQSNVYGQLQGIANGTGPNPAQAMLNQSTGQNIANQAALMAGQRGASSNVGLIARQAAQQGANTQQQAVGQGATMQANQSLNALNAAGTMANSMATNQIGQTNANTGAQQAEQSALLNAQNSFNSAQTSSQGNINSANAGMANTRLGQQGSAIGGLFQGAGAALGFADGGAVPSPGGGGSGGYPGQSEFGAFLHGAANQAPADVAQADIPIGGQPTDQLQKGTSEFSKGLVGKIAGGGGGAGSTAMAGGFGDSVASLAPLAMVAAHGGQVPAVVSPGEKYLSPQDVQAVKQGANPMKVGETIPGQPKVGGAKDSYKNDVVPKTLQEGGIVVPRSKTQSKDPEKASADFVHSILAKRVAKGKR